MKVNKYLKIISLGCVVLIGAGFIVPENPVIPVVGATEKDWNSESFWYEPWGTSGVHKGVDIFASTGTPIVATVSMLVLYRGNFSKGGKVIIGLGPKWRIHYFAHLSAFSDNALWRTAGEPLGFVGDSGNARGKPPHLHYAIVSLVPLLWLIDRSSQGFKKAFYLNPITYLNSTGR